MQVQCYNSSAKVKAWMAEHGMDPSCPPHPPGTVAQADRSSRLLANPCSNGGVGFKHLVAYFLRQVQALARKHGKQPSGWQEIFDHYGGNNSHTPTPPIEGLDPNTVIYDWLAPGWGWGTPATITKAGYRAVSTLGLYISSDPDNTDWIKYYTTHPLTSTTNSSANHSSRGWFNITQPD